MLLDGMLLNLLYNVLVLLHFLSTTRLLGLQVLAELLCRLRDTPTHLQMMIGSQAQSTIGQSVARLHSIAERDLELVEQHCPGRAELVRGDVVAALIGSKQRRSISDKLREQSGYLYDHKSVPSTYCSAELSNGGP